MSSLWPWLLSKLLPLLPSPSNLLLPVYYRGVNHSSLRGSKVRLIVTYSYIELWNSSMDVMHINVVSACSFSQLNVLVPTLGARDVLIKDWYMDKKKVLLMYQGYFCIWEVSFRPLFYLPLILLKMIKGIMILNSLGKVRLIRIYDDTVSLYSY